MRAPTHATLLILLVLVSVAGCDDNSGRFIWEREAKSPALKKVQTIAPAPAQSTSPTNSVAAQPTATSPEKVESVPETTRPFEFARDDSGATQNQGTRCGFDNLVLPANAKIFAAGAYSGRNLDYQIDQSGHQATQTDVAVNHVADPVVLMLGDYEPTVWNIGWSQGTHIAAVIVSGYHRQVVAGLPSSVPVLISTYDNKGACGYFYVGSDNLGALNPLARRLFNRSVDMVYPSKDGKVVIGDLLNGDIALVTGTGKTPESYRDVKVPLAGQAGLDDAVRNGLIREATSSDAIAWANAQATLPANADLPPIAGVGRPPPRVPGLFHAYVVLKPFVVPAGLYGANAATFFVPKGVSRPTGNLGHSRLYDFNTLTCAGVTCGFE